MEDIKKLLHDSNADESDLSKSLRSQAEQLITSTPDPGENPSIFEDLLIKTVKPLFAKSQHPAITSTGRKVLVSAPSLPDRFGNDSVFDAAPPWKNGWTVPLITWILESYNTLTLPPTNKKTTVESNFHLLVPPILNLIDDAEIAYKVHGCNCLHTLCTTLIGVQSDILKRTGLSEVFVDALKNCFHYLPTLTPEDESLMLLESLYPAYLALVHARFVVLESITRQSEALSEEAQVQRDDKTKQQDNNDDAEIINITIPHNPGKTTKSTSLPSQQQSTLPTLTPSQITTETDQRNTQLTLLLRHSLLYTLTHLSRSAISNTTSPTITTYLLTQIPLLLRPMSLDANVHLQTLIPLLVDVLRDPFATAAPDLLGGAVEALEGVVGVCWVRVRERWWVEVLRGCVGVWGNVMDDLEVGVDDRRKEGLQRVTERVSSLLRLLGDVVGEERFISVLDTLVSEEPALEGMLKSVRTG